MAQPKIVHRGTSSGGQEYIPSLWLLDAVDVGLQSGGHGGVEVLGSQGEKDLPVDFVEKGHKTCPVHRLLAISKQSQKKSSFCVVFSLGVHVTSLRESIWFHSPSAGASVQPKSKFARHRAPVGGQFAWVRAAESQPSVCCSLSVGRMVHPRPPNTIPHPPASLSQCPE